MRRASPGQQSCGVASALAASVPAPPAPPSLPQHSQRDVFDMEGVENSADVVAKLLAIAPERVNVAERLAKAGLE